MSENQNRRCCDYSKYDTMATEELEAILRLDAEAPEGQESDTELLLYVMEVLHKANITILQARMAAIPGITGRFPSVQPNKHICHQGAFFPEGTPILPLQWGECCSIL